METNTLTQEEFDYIKNIDTQNYLVDNIDIENDPIYKKLSELDIINNPEKTKQCLHNLVEKFTVIEDDTEDIDKIEFYKFIFCIHINFIKILEKEGNLSSLIDILSNCGLFDFVESEQLVSSLQNFTYAASINFDEYNNELLHNFILKLCKDNVNNINSIVNGYVAGYLFNREDVSNLINFINVLINNNQKNVFDIISMFVINYLSLDDNNLMELGNIVNNLINNNPDNIGIIFDAFIQGFLSFEEFEVLDLINVIGQCISKNINKTDVIKEMINTFTQRYLLTKTLKSDELKIIINKLINDNQISISGIISGFVQGCLSQSKNISEIQDAILELVKQNEQNPDNIINIINSFIQVCLSQNKDIKYTKYIFFELIEKRKKDSFLYINNLSEMINGFVQGYLFQGKNISEIENIVVELIKQQDDCELTNIVSGFVQGYLTQNRDISEIKDVFFKIIKLSPYYNSCWVAEGFIRGCLKQNNITEKIQDIIFELAKQYPYRIMVISETLMNGYFLQNKLTLEIQNTIFKLLKQNPIYVDEIAYCIIDKCLSNNKSISDIKNFIIETSKQENIEIDIIYSIIKMCCLNNKVQIGSENFKQLIQVINNPQNQKKEESQKILCGMYISDYLLKIHQNKIDKDNITISQEFIDLLNEVLQRQENNKITKIEDLTVKEIKILFNDLMNIKFNQTKKSVGSNILESGPFLQIITSLAENSGVGEDITIEELFNKQKETIKKTEEKSDEQLTKIETFQKKLNNFSYVEIKKNTDINSTEDFIEILGLKPEDFGKPGFKTFYINFPGHAVSIVVDTSKTYKEFIKNNRYILKNIVIIDSSQALNWNINNGKLKFFNPNTKDFIKKIPVPNFNYQENGTCWGNTTCANSALLNNYKNFDEIVEKNEKGEIIGLKEGVQENIINETSKYYISNTEIETNKSKYCDVKQTNIVAAEFRSGVNVSVVYNDKQTTYNDEYTIKSNVKQEQLFQQPLEVFKAQQFELKNKIAKIEELKEQLKKKEIFEKEFEEKCEKYGLNINLQKEKIELEKSLSINVELDNISINKTEEFNKKYEEYKKHKEEFKKLNKRLDLIVDVKLDYISTFGKEGQVENFRCYTNSKHANDTILSFDMYMENKDKKVSIKFVLKDTDIKTVNKEFIQQWGKKIKTNGLESYLKENCEIKVKTEGLKNYVNLRESYHKNRICEMVKSGVGLRMK